MMEHVVEADARTLADDNSDRLRVQHKLARAYWEANRTIEAVELLEHVVKVRGKLHARNHTEMLYHRHSLATAYLCNNQIAIEVFEHVVKLYEKLPQTDSNRLASQHELARAWWLGQRIPAALCMIEHVVKV